MKTGIRTILGAVLMTLPAAVYACEPDTTLALESYRTIVQSEQEHLIETDIVIDAPASEVWRVLTDFENMSSWSTALQNMSGDIRDGGKVTVLYQVGDRKSEIAHVLSFKDGEEFGWTTELKGPAPGIFDHHKYRVEAISDCQTRFVQNGSFKGVSEAKPDRTTAFFAERVLPGYRKFNHELKAEVERRAK